MSSIKKWTKNTQLPTSQMVAMEEGVIMGSHISIDIYPLLENYVKYLHKFYSLCNQGD